MPEWFLYDNPRLFHNLIRPDARLRSRTTPVELPGNALGVCILKVLAKRREG